MALPSLQQAQDLAKQLARTRLMTALSQLLRTGKCMVIVLNLLHFLVLTSPSAVFEAPRTKSRRTSEPGSQEQQGCGACEDCGSVLVGLVRGRAALSTAEAQALAGVCQATLLHPGGGTWLHACGFPLSSVMQEQQSLEHETGADAGTVWKQVCIWPELCMLTCSCWQLLACCYTRGLSLHGLLPMWFGLVQVDILG